MSTVESAFAIIKQSEETAQTTEKTKGLIWKSAAAKLLDPTSEMDESQRKEYEAKITRKLKSGKRLTSQEMNYLRIHNPMLYQVAKRVEAARQSFRERLKHCKSKDEVNQVIAGELQMVSAIKKEPDKEYMAAMVKHEADTFRKSRSYAKLPQKEVKGVKKKRTEEDPFKAEDEKDAGRDGEDYQGMNVLIQVQFQCNQISQMAQGFL